MDNDANSSLPACAAEFIDAVIRKTRCRKKIRADVRRELTTHFIDALAEYASGERRDFAADELIARFGDPRLLATLIRRAKKRCRPIGQTILVRSLQTIAVLLLLLTLYTIWFSMGKPNISTDYLAILNDRAKPPQAEDANNAWPHYEEAIQLYVEPPERIDPHMFSGIYIGDRYDVETPGTFADLDEDRQRLLRQWLTENRSEWDKLDDDLKALVGQFHDQGLMPAFINALTTDPNADPNEFEAGDLVVVCFANAINDVVRYATGDDEEYLYDDEYYYEEMMQMEMAAAGQMESMEWDVAKPVSIALFRDGFQLDPNLPSELKLETVAPKPATGAAQARTAVALIVGAVEHWIANPRRTSSEGFYPYEIEALQGWVADNDETWESVVRGGGQPHCYRQYSFAEGNELPHGWLINIDLPNLAELRQLAYFGRQRARYALEDGRLRSAFDDCLVTARMGAHLQGMSTIIEQLVGISTSKMAHKEIRSILDRNEMTLEDLTWLSDEVAQLYAGGYPLVDMEFEKLLFMDVVQHFFTDSGPGGGHLIPEAFIEFDGWRQRIGGPEYIAPKLPVSTAIAMSHAGRDKTVAMGKRLLEQAQRGVLMTPFARRASNVDCGQQLFNSLNPRRYDLVRVMMPPVAKVSELMYEGRALYEAMVAVIAVEQWRLQQGQYPDDLVTLVDAGLLKAPPMDPYSDKPLVYRKTDTGFILYSIAGDFVDDGGVVKYGYWGGAILSGDPISQGEVEGGGDIVYWPIPEPRRPRQSNRRGD